MPEFDADLMIACGAFEQDDVERRAADGVDDFLVLLPIGLQRALPGPIVQHAPAHRDQERLHVLHDAGTLKGADAARGQRKIDGTTRGRDRRARISAALIESDGEPAARQQQGEQGSCKSRADDIHRLPRQRSQAALPNACSKCSRKCQTSSKRL